MEEPTVTKISYAAESPRNRGSISGKGKDLYISQNCHTSCGTHPASYLMGNKDSFPNGKATWRELTTIWCRG
jgi:hypothetical protein